MNVRDRRFLSEVMEALDDVSGEQARRLERECVRRIEEIDRKRTVRIVRVAPRRAAEQSKKEERREKMAGIRADIFNRSGGLCELCRRVPMTEVHHLIGGSLRRSREATDNCMGLCHACHHLATNNNFITMAAIEVWAKKNASVEASACVTRRLTKIAKMRSEP